MLTVNQMTGFGGGGEAALLTEPAPGFQAWYSPATIQQTSNVVTAWNDASPNALHFNTSSGSPSFLANSINNYAGIEFDGTDDYLQRTGGLGDIPSSTAYTYFLVFNINSVGTNSATVINNDAIFFGLSEWHGVHVRSNGTLYAGHVEAGNALKFVSFTFSTGNNYILMCRFDGSTVNAQLNSTVGSGVVSGNTGISGSVSFARNLSGTAPFSAFKISEAIFYQSHIAVDDRIITLNYLASKYGITIS